MSELDPKDPDVEQEYAIDFSHVLVPFAPRSTDIGAGRVVRARRDTGWYYECTTPGRTSAEYPRMWPRESGATIQDGSVIWTARRPADVTVPTVQSAQWTVPAPLSEVSTSESGFLALIVVSGGVDGEDYALTCRMTPTTGKVIEQTITVPVRAA